MTIVFDAKTENTATADRNTVTFAHTNSGNNLGLLVFVGHIDAAPVGITSATYNAVAMTEEVALNEPVAGGHIRIGVFSLNAPASGANNVVVTWVDNVIGSFVVAISYTGCDQSDLVEATASANGTSNTPAVAVTSLTAGAMIVGGYTFRGGDGDPSAPGDTERWDLATGADVNSDIASAGGELLLAAAGAGTVNMTANASDEWVMAGVALKSLSLQQIIIY